MAPPRALVWSRNGVPSRGFLLQGVVFALILALAGYLAFNLIGNFGARSIHTGFAFLHATAGFDIGEGFIAYDGHATYGRALLVGLLNTLAVSSAGLFLSTLIGSAVGLGRLSRNPLVGALAGTYVEALRNVPLLLHLYLCYAVLTELLPQDGTAAAFLPGFYLAKSGLHFPVVAEKPVVPLFALAAGLLVAALLRHRAKRRQARTGKHSAAWRLWALALVPAALLLLWMLASVPLDVPQERRFGFVGGGTLTPELTALLIGLSLYNSAFVAEIMRGAVQSVGLGQSEAAAALGLRPGQRLRLIVVPQALRVALPPLASQYLNLAKNSSLAVAIGYPDLMSVASTVVNQTGQALEVIGMVMAAYLTLSLAIAAFMNSYNARVRVTGSS